jgi:O-antigen ligase
MSPTTIVKSSPRALSGLRERRGSLLALRPSHLALAYVAIVAATELRYKPRGSVGALPDAVDAQAIFELAVLGGVVVWLANAVLRPGASRRLASLRGIGPSSRVLVGVTVMVLVSGFLFAPFIRSAVRAAEFAVLTILTVVSFHRLRELPGGLHDFWLWARRWFWALAGLATLLTLFIRPLSTQLAALMRTHPRYAWMAILPIPTGGMLGLALLMALGAYLAIRDEPLQGSSLRRSLVVATALAGIVLLAATKARGATLALLAGMGILSLLAPRGRRRSLATLGAWAVAVVVASGLLDAQLTRVLVRGQTEEQLISLSDRARVFDLAWDFFWARPLFGHGYGAVASLFPPYIPWAGDGHNVAVEVAISFGALGLAAFGLLLVVIAGLLLRALGTRSRQSRCLAAEACGLFAFLLPMSMVTESFAGRPGFQTVMLMWLVLMADSLWADHAVTFSGEERHP